MKKSLILAGLLILAVMRVSADDEWIHIYTNAGNGKMRVDSRKPENISAIKYSEGKDTTLDVMQIYDSNMDMTSKNLRNVLRVEVGRHVPTLYINIENGLEVVEKDTYLNAEVMIEGNGVVDDFPMTSTTIKGRGNSTWQNFPKKPWRLKFSKKQSLCGLAKAKNYALIANFIDPTKMRNTVALHIGHLLDMPWTNHSIPVNIVMNGTYRGLYMLTEKIGINSGSVDIDETKGILWELDTNFDEAFKFRSAGYSLPVMVKDPDFEEIALDNPSGLTADELFNEWRDDFETMEAAVMGITEADWVDYIDLTSLVKYVFVNSLVGNHEPTWPKSVYLHKAQKSDKYTFGPLWDFDWAFTFGGRYQEGAGDPRQKWVTLPKESGGRFFTRLCQDTRFRTEFKSLIDKFYDEQFDGLLEYIDEYAALIRPAAYQDGERWRDGSSSDYPDVASSEKFDIYIDTMKTFLRERMEFMRSDLNFGLY